MNKFICKIVKETHLKSHAFGAKFHLDKFYELMDMGDNWGYVLENSIFLLIPSENATIEFNKDISLSEPEILSFQDGGDLSLSKEYWKAIFGSTKLTMCIKDTLKGTVCLSKPLEEVFVKDSNAFSITYTNETEKSQIIQIYIAPEENLRAAIFKVTLEYSKVSPKETRTFKIKLGSALYEKI